MKNVKFKVVAEEARNYLPKYATEGAAGMDLHAMLYGQGVNIPSGGVVGVGVGIAVHIQDTNVCGLVIPRSGLGSNKGIVLANLTGVIDSDYQGEIVLKLWNRSKIDYWLNDLERVGQLIFVPVLRPDLVEVEEFDEVTARGSNGFGSTGS